MSKYKTCFVPTEKQKGNNAIANLKTFKVDGVELTNHIQALIEENEASGYELFSVETVASAKSQASFTEGMIVIFKKA